MEPRMIEWGYRILLLSALLWGHWSIQHSTIFVGAKSSRGIPPVTQHALPISADDLARGLLANPPEALSMNTLQQAHELRYILSQQQHDLQILRSQQQERAIQALRRLEAP